MGSVAPEALARLAAMRRPEQESRASGTSAWSFDARAVRDANDADLAALGITVSKSKPAPGGGQLWELTDCPYSPDHDDSAFRIQYPDGGIHVGCHHDRCQGKTIKGEPRLFPRTTALRPAPRTSPATLRVGTRTAGIAPDGAGTGPDDATNRAEPVSVPEFPSGVLPPALRAYVRAAARGIRVPEEMIAVPMLVFAGATIGNRLQVTLKRGWSELPTLYAAVVADPGSAKSPSLMAAQWPIHKLQEDAYGIWKDQQAVFESELSQWNDTPKGERGPKPEAPTLHHLYSTDPTMEALVSMLNQVQGIAVIRDELMGWVNSLDKYRGGKGGDKEEFLQLWAGAPIKADRKGGGTIFASSPVVGVYGGIQRDRARGLHDPDGKRDGWIERMLMFDPDVEPTEWTDDDLDPALLQPVVNIYGALRTIQKPDHGNRHSVVLSPDARCAWIDWYNDNASATKSAQGLRRGFYSKLPGQVARIALILNSLWNHDDPQRMVSEERMADAIAIGEWFRSHLDRVLPLIGDTSQGAPVGLASRILRILRTAETQQGDGWVRRGALLHKLGNVPTVELSDALSRLQSSGAVELRIVATSTKPGEEWRISREPRSKNSKNSNNSNNPGSHEADSSNTSNSSNGVNPERTDPDEPTGTDGREEF